MPNLLVQRPRQRRLPDGTTHSNQICCVDPGVEASIQLRTLNPETLQGRCQLARGLTVLTGPVLHSWEAGGQVPGIQLGFSKARGCWLHRGQPGLGGNPAPQSPPGNVARCVEHHEPKPGRVCAPAGEGRRPAP